MTESPHPSIIKCAMDGGEVRPPEKPGAASLEKKLAMHRGPTQGRQTTRVQIMKQDGSFVAV